MMGVTDFPIEVLHLLRIKPAAQSSSGEESVHSPGSSIPNKDAAYTRSKTDVSLVAEGTSVSSDASGVSLATQDSPTTEANADSGLPSPSQEQTHTLLSTSTPDHRRLLAKSFGRSSSRSQSPKRKSSTNNQGKHAERVNSSPDAAHMSLEAAVGAGKGVGRMVGVGLKSPMDFTLSLARGFHNAPKLYGDESVRPADKVTDFQSGLKAAGKVGFDETLVHLGILTGHEIRSSATGCLMAYQDSSRNHSKEPRRKE